MDALNDVGKGGCWLDKAGIISRQVIKQYSDIVDISAAQPARREGEGRREREGKEKKMTFS
jgi:hypothetical protein